MTFQSASVTLKNRSRSQKSNKQFPFSQQCIYASLIKSINWFRRLAQKQYFWDFKVLVWPWKKGQGHQNVVYYSPSPNNVCKFGENPSTSSKDNAQKPYFGHFQSAAVTLKIWSRSPNFNQLFPFSQQCIYASLVKIHPLVQKITHRNHILGISKCPCDLENKVKVIKI